MAICRFPAAPAFLLREAARTSLTYQNGTLTLLAANHHPLDRLIFDGTYTAADFGLKTIAGGTEISYAGPTAATFVSLHAPPDTSFWHFGGNGHSV